MTSELAKAIEAAVNEIDCNWYEQWFDAETNRPKAIGYRARHDWLRSVMQKHLDTLTQQHADEVAELRKELKLWKDERTYFKKEYGKLRNKLAKAEPLYEIHPDQQPERQESPEFVEHLKELAKYNFRDDHGHPLGNCQEYIDLTAKLAKAEAVLNELCAIQANNGFTALAKLVEVRNKAIEWKDEYEASK